MKRLLTLFAMLALCAGFFALPAGAVATGETAESYEKTQAYITAATATTQGGGEMPVIHVGDRFNLVVKVVDHSAAYFEIPACDIAARVNSSVFTFTGTAEVGQLFEEKDPVTNTEYYTYVLIFRDIIYNGGGNEFITDLSYLNSTLAMQQLKFTLGQCEDKEEEAGNARTPNLMVRQSSYGGGTVVAGEEFILTATVYATDGTESLNDVQISLTLTEGVELTGGQMSAYVGRMAPHATQDVSFGVRTNAAFKGGVATITFNLTGTGADSGTAVTGTSAVSVPITQPDRFEITGTEISDTIYVGQGGSVTINFVNKGLNPVANLEAYISGTNLGADLPRQYFGNLNAGSENSIDFDLYPEQPGPVEGTITLSYEGPDGKVKTLTKDFASTAMEMESFYDPGFVDEGMTPEEQPSAGLPLWGIALIAAAVIAAAVAVVLLVRKRRKAKALASLEAADDEDF